MSRRKTHDSFSEVFAVDIGVYYAEMRISASMNGDLVHNLPTCDCDNANGTIISFHSRMRHGIGNRDLPVVGHRLTGRSSSPNISQANRIRSRILYLASNTLPIVSSCVSMSVMSSVACNQHIIGDVSLEGTKRAAKAHGKALKTPSYP